MDNKNIATLLYETADLMEINGDDSFRIRSYRRAGEAIESLGEQVEKLICEPKKMLEVPGIGRGMLANLQEICEHGDLTARRELLSKYRPSMLELAEDLRPWSEDHCSSMERISGCGSRWRREACQGRQDPHSPPHGREAGTEDPQVDRRLQTYRRPFPHRRSGPHRA